MTRGTKPDEGTALWMLGALYTIKASSKETAGRFSVVEMLIPPGGSAGDEPYTLPAEVELVYVLRGSLELRVGDETHLLEEGDTLSYSPRDPHTWRNPSETDEAVVLWTALPNPYAV